MERIKITENFFLDEFCGKDLHDKIKNDPDALYQYLDKRIVILVQWIRTQTGKSLMINTWANGGALKERCIRMPETKTGASKSRHKINFDAKGLITKKCDAVDITIGSMNGEKMYNWAQENKIALHGLGVRCIEHYSLTSVWLHLDMRPTKFQNIINIVDLSKVVDVWKIN